MNDNDMLSLEKNPEWRDENTLTARLDRDHENKEVYLQKLRTDRRTPPLTNDELDEAMKDLCTGDPVPNYPQVDRLYSDPPLPFQKWGLFSFVPAKGATPDKDGVYGMAKLRGNFDRPEDMEEREEFLIRNVDSYHKIQRPFVGRPFPITVDPRYSAEIKEIDIAKKTTEVMSSDIKEQKKQDSKEIQEIKQREEELKRDVTTDPEDVDPMELYTTLVVKRAQLTFTFLEHFKKLLEVKDIIVKTRKQIVEMDEKDDTYRKGVYDKYMNARKEVALPDDDNSFLKYIVEDIQLPFDKNPTLFGDLELPNDMVTPQPPHTSTQVPENPREVDGTAESLRVAQEQQAAAAKVTDE